MYVSKNMTYKELVAIVHTIVKYDANKFNVDLQSISIVPGTTCRTFIRNDDDVQFMLGEDRGDPSSSNQVFTQRSATGGGENMCIVPPVVVDHADVVEPQFNDYFGCRIEMNDEQNNELYNEQNTEPNIEQNNDPNHEVDNKANNDQVDDLENMDEKPVQIQTCGRRVQGVSFTTPDMHRTSEVRHNVTASDSDNATTWVIPRVDLYLFAIGRSSTLVAQEPTSMIYKGQCFPSKGFEEASWPFCNTGELGMEEQQNAGTITNLQCTDDEVSWRCMGHVIAVDGTHLKGRFGGTMFVTTVQDGNEQVYPIAFGYGDSENNLSWEWFLDCLKGALCHIDDLVFISDRYSSIESGISKVFPYAIHTICCWYFSENIKKRFHRKDVADIIDKTTRSYSELAYNRHMEK
ncbi:hypothetical protein Dsin_032027 [Dipteronia sinensis]|uniref:MULE transposase domain-containing protein n=1 Tax=Dipteronia sinensis TaxID=43782 RepID=A0AAE0DSN9_9ROSI|nr:hypothetical protein Dsin_032027 [Dipteronia sinensis]